jgi:hypothetical protein
MLRYAFSRKKNPTKKNSKKIGNQKKIMLKLLRM